MNTKKLIEELNANGAKFSIHTNIAYGRGINGVGFDSYKMYEETGAEGNPRTKIYRTFEPKEDYLIIREKYVYPEIPWNKNVKPGIVEHNIYLGYDKITYINENCQENG